MRIPSPRAVTYLEFAAAAKARAEERYPLFNEIWNNAFLPLICTDTQKRVLVEGYNPPRYVLAWREWRIAGIPPVRVTYRFPDKKSEPILIESIVIQE